MSTSSEQGGLVLVVSVGRVQDRSRAPSDHQDSHFHPEWETRENPVHDSLEHRGKIDDCLSMTTDITFARVCRHHVSVGREARKFFRFHQIDYHLDGTFLDDLFGHPLMKIVFFRCWIRTSQQSMRDDLKCRIATGLDRLTRRREKQARVPQ